MGQVTVDVNGRSYRFDCGDGEEARLQELATYVKDRFDALKSQYGPVGPERLLLMAALLITDELWDARASVKDAASAGAKKAAKPAPDQDDDSNPPDQKLAASGDG
jgi:cell division protein ZapA